MNIGNTTNKTDKLSVTGNMSVSGTITAPTFSGTATTATIAEKLKTPRLLNYDANSLDSQYTFNISELSNNSTNLPINRWSHLFTTQGLDINYATQLCLSMTDTPNAYIRIKNASVWSEWDRLVKESDLGSYLPLSGGTMTGPIHAKSIYISDDGGVTNGSAIHIGDDAYIKDIDATATIGIIGSLTDTSSYGGVAFGINSHKLGVYSGSTLTYDSNIVWHAGNDGSGSGLDADMLDGLQLTTSTNSTGVMHSYGRGTYTTVNQYFGNGNVVVIDPSPTDDGNLWPNTTIFSLGDNPDRNTQLAFSYYIDTIKYRRNTDSWSSWQTLAFLSSNVASSTTSTTAVNANNLYTDATTDTIYFLGVTSSTSSTSPVYKIANAMYYGNTTGIFFTSDKRRKHDISTVDDKTISYLFSHDCFKHFIWNHNDKNSFGVIAQETEQWCPEAVNEENNYLAVNYQIVHSKAIGALIKKIKQLEKRLSELEK